MSEKKPNYAHSVRQRLLNLSRERGEEFQFVLNRYALERLLARLSRSSQAERFVLKGAMLFALWTGLPHRATKDLDLLAQGSNVVADMVEVFRDFCGETREEEALVFDAESVAGERIKEDQDYEAVRIRLSANLGSARIALQVDVGFGDATYPEPEMVEYPSLLGFPPAWVRAYQKETVVAEKFHAMTVLGIGNSRMKDFYDLWVMSREFEFDVPPGKRTPLIP